jgi:hypothetical protein
MRLEGLKVLYYQAPNACAQFNELQLVVHVTGMLWLHNSTVA